MDELRDFLGKVLNKIEEPYKSEIENSLENLTSVYPFNEYEFQISNFIGLSALSREEYLIIRNEYIGRNLFLHVFEIAGPRTFGENWAQSQLKSLVPSIEKPTKRVDSTYAGEYDFYLDDLGKIIKIEVKASRAVDADSRDVLAHKALSSKSTAKFVMNFQQIKTYCADVFVFIAVWRDEIKYWVFNSLELEGLAEYQSGQHRGNQGEGQIHFKNTNIRNFDKYLIAPSLIEDAIKSAYQRKTPKI